MAIRVKASNHSYNPPSVAWLHGGPGNWRCTLDNGTPAAFSYAGIDSEMSCKFALDDADTDSAAILAAVLAHARRYRGGERDGQTVYSYELQGLHP